MEDQVTMSVRVTQATELIWEGQATSVSSVNVDGPFDVLPMHANFVTLIQNKPITVVRADGTSETYDFKQAVMYVEDNSMKIYADIV